MMTNKHGTQKIQYLMYMLIVLCSPSCDLKLKVQVAHAVWPVYLCQLLPFLVCCGISSSFEGLSHLLWRFCFCFF